MVFYIHTIYTKIYTRYIQNTERRRGRPARPGPEARAPVRPGALTNLREISMRVFFNSNTCGKMTVWSKQIQQCCFLWNKSLGSRTPHTKVDKKNKCSDRIYLNSINLTMYNIIQLIYIYIKNHIKLHKFDEANFKNCKKTTPLSWSLCLVLGRLEAC